MTAKELIGEGNSFLSRKEFDRALSSFNKAQKLIPEQEKISGSLAYLQSVRGKAQAYLGLHQYDNALSEFELVLSFTPHNFILVSGRGCALLGAGRALEALLSFETALLQNPDDQQALKGKAKALALTGHYNAAKSLYNYLLEENDRDTNCLFQAAYLQIYLGNYIVMQTHLQNILDIDDENFNARCYLGFSLLFQKMYADAKNKFNLAKQQAKENNSETILSLATIGLARIAAIEKDKKYAKKLKNDALALVSEHHNDGIDVLLLYGTSLMATASSDKTLKKALSYFDTILKYSPNTIGAAFQKGKIQISLNDNKAARKTFREILKQSPNNREILKRLRSLSISAQTCSTSPDTSPSNLRNSLNSEIKDEHSNETKLQINVILPEETLSGSSSSPASPLSPSVSPQSASHLSPHSPSLWKQRRHIRSNYYNSEPTTTDIKQEEFFRQKVYVGFYPEANVNSGDQSNTINPQTTTSSSPCCVIL